MEIIRKTIENDGEYLRQISKEVLFNDDTYKKDIKLLEDFCKNTACFALAAVQIGIPKRIVYLKNTTLDIALEDKNYNEAKVLINPVIISQRGLTKYWESCVSCLDYTGLVYRPYEMIINYYDQYKQLHEEKFEGFGSTVLSHELDHLDGILHMDIAEEVLDIPKAQRGAFRENHPYEIISKTCDYNKKVRKLVK